MVWVRVKKHFKERKREKKNATIALSCIKRTAKKKKKNKSSNKMKKGRKFEIFVSNVIIFSSSYTIL